MVEFISKLIGNEYLATLIMSFFPLIELKGGIVYARAFMGFLKAFSLAYVGSTLAFVLVFLLLNPILNLLKKIKWFNKFALKIENYFNEKANDTILEQQTKQDKSARKKLSLKALKQVSVFIFVAFPLPMTGVWTGTAIAVFLGLKFKEAVLPVAIGNLIAGLIISLLAEVCLFFGSIVILDYILYVLFALAIILLILVILKIARQNTKQ